MKSITFGCDPDLDAFELGVVGGQLWAGDGYVLGALGVAERIPLERTPAGADEAQARLKSMIATDDVGGPATGPVAFTAMPFDPDLPGELVVPEIVLGHREGGPSWVTVTGGSVAEPGQALERIGEALSAPRRGEAPDSIEIDAVLPPEVWRDQVVATARDRIRAGRLTKAVLARELVVRASSAIDREAVLRRLAATHSSATVFSLDGFLGASPERLVSRIDDVVRAHPLAGTTRRASDPDDDDRAAEDLLASTKDRGEHRITIDWLLDELLPFCSYVDAEPSPSIVSLPNVHHLGTEVEGRLSSPAASVLELVDALHPTPAVGGDPQHAALELIAELEQADRGRYGGPMGWVDWQGNGSFVVAIRSAQVDGASARLFAGVGVVADSDPEAELEETRAKFEAMLPALRGT